MPTGARLLFRSREEWRAATISGITGDRISIHIASPRGRTYRITRTPDTELHFDGRFFRLAAEFVTDKAPFATYDPRW